MEQTTFTKTRIAEFDWLKLSALLLLLFVHSDLYYIFPGIFLPVMWLLVGDFLFVSGFLAFESLHKRRASIKDFFRSKVWSLYVPFAVAAVFYFHVQVATGVAPWDPLRLSAHVFMLNVFDGLNTGLYNWSFLWFVPYLLLFMLVFCVFEKYVKSARYQVLGVAVVWVLSLLAWVFNAPLKLGLVFSQYFLVFMAGFWVNKFGKYNGITRFRTALVVVPLAVLFALDFSASFPLNTAPETLLHLVYSNGRSVVLSLSLILLILLLLRKIRIPRIGYVELIAETSIFIYLTEPFLNYILITYLFGKTLASFGAGAYFYLYLLLRVAFLFVFLPLVFKAVKTFRAGKKA